MAKSRVIKVCRSSGWWDNISCQEWLSRRITEFPKYDATGNRVEDLDIYFAKVAVENLRCDLCDEMAKSIIPNREYRFSGKVSVHKVTDILSYEMVAELTMELEECD